MDHKYWVPAVARADAIVKLIAAQPGKLKLIELSRQLDIHKSSMFSLLHTLEQLEWLAKDADDTYRLGAGIGKLGAVYVSHYDLTEAFHSAAKPLMDTLGETLQLGRLEGGSVYYLAKENARSPVRIASEPGMTFPAYATALGKIMLAALQPEQVRGLYEQALLPPLTPYTIHTVDALMDQLQAITVQGYAFDLQEAIEGFCCVAAPIYDVRGLASAAVSCSMPLHQWELKRERAIAEILLMAAKLSLKPKQLKE